MSTREILYSLKTLFHQHLLTTEIHDQLFCYFPAELHQQVTVDCELDQMRVHIAKSLIPDFELKDVRLLDVNCQPTKSENSSHMTITAPLIGCGTTLEYTTDSLIYRNMVKDGLVTQSIISRLQVCFSNGLVSIIA